jgi:hypothetical protein
MQNHEAIIPREARGVVTRLVAFARSGLLISRNGLLVSDIQGRLFKFPRVLTEQPKTLAKIKP